MKKVLSALISVVLAVTLCVTTCTSAFAATFNGKKYVKEMIISYGKTEDEAKKWLTDNDYEVIDNNLNDGADNSISTKRAVYVGYKTTNNADEAITDMKVMNMKGGYSIQDYQLLLEEQKTNIKQFFSNFKVAIEEYRINYAANQKRAVAAHGILNLLYDDDTKQNLGDLLLKKVREEYTDEEYEALSDDEKAKVADMTTIIMQGNSDAVLAMEQVLAMATDESDTPWVGRYQKAKTYDEMIDRLMAKENLTVNAATKKLAAEYDQDAEIIASMLEGYKTYLETYVDSGITLTSSVKDIEKYEKAHADFDKTDWIAAGTQYELIQTLENDGATLYDLIFDDAFDVENADRYMLYPLVSVLSDGQRACLEYISMKQLVSYGISDDATIEALMKAYNIESIEETDPVSVYDGVDRSIFGGDVALTGDAYKLQSSTGKNATESWMDSFSKTTGVLWLASVIAGGLATICWKVSPVYLQKSFNYAEIAERLNNQEFDVMEKGIANNYSHWKEGSAEAVEKERLFQEKTLNQAQASRAKGLAKFFKIASVVMVCVTIALMLYSIWNTYQDLKSYYNAEFTPIPSNMVNQGVDENDEKVYTYYKAVKCNREAQGMVTDSTKLLGDFGDLNGDVGRQWLALYTTKDQAAGDPITTDFVVQTGNSDVPADSTALSIFCESVAQNLTNKKAGYTYADSKNGIYLFYGTDESAFAGSAISNGTYALIGGGVAIIVAAVAFYLGTVTEKKKGKKQNA